MIPLDKGYCPDYPKEMPGILSLSQKTIPSETGMKRSSEQENPGGGAAVDALAATPRGAETLTKLDGSNRVFAGTAAELYEKSGTTWTTVSSASYTLGSNSRWSFTQFGDTSLATCLDVVIQQTSSGNFAAVSGAPKARIIESLVTSGGGFVLAFNTIDGTYGTSPDRWWCSALNDATSSTAWTPSIAAQCATGRLLGYEGQITAARKFGGDKIIAYKDNSAYIGQYVGPPGVFAWQEFPGVGCLGPEAVADLGSAHFVVSQDDIYIFDGVRKVSVANQVKKYFKDQLDDKTFGPGTIALYDRYNEHVRVFFPIGTGSVHSLGKCLVYHVRRGIWGLDDANNLSPFMYPSTGGPFVPAVFNTSNVLKTITGTPTSFVSITLPEAGSEVASSMLKEVRLFFRTAPSASTIGGSTKMSKGGSYTFVVSQSAYDSPGGGMNIYRVRQTGRWHQIGFTLTSSFDLEGYEYDLVPVGKR